MRSAGSSRGTGPSPHAALTRYQTRQQQQQKQGSSSLTKKNDAASLGPLTRSSRKRSRPYDFDDDEDADADEEEAIEDSVSVAVGSVPVPVPVPARPPTSAPSVSGRTKAAASAPGTPASSKTGSGSGSAQPLLVDGRTRRSGPGTRGVANLTPEQLAKKRANDREAQRAIRERTRNQIETLERRIQELTSRKEYQELQAALKAKAAAEAENAEIKRRLASIIDLIQPLISSGAIAIDSSDSQEVFGAETRTGDSTNRMAAADHHNLRSVDGLPPPPPPPPQLQPSHLYIPSSSSFVPPSVQHASSLTPTSTASPGGPGGSSLDRAGHQQLSHSYPHPQLLEWAGMPTPMQSSGGDRYGLDYLMGASTRAGRSQGSLGATPGSAGHHDSYAPDTRAPQPIYRHHYAHHPTHQHQQQRHLPPPPPPPAAHLDPNLDPRLGLRLDPRLDPRLDLHLDSNIDPNLDSNLDPSLDPRLAHLRGGSSIGSSTGSSIETITAPGGGRSASTMPIGLPPTKNCPPTCALDSVLLDFLAERRQRACEGEPMTEVVGPPVADVGLLLSDGGKTATSSGGDLRPPSRPPHVMSKVVADILQTFPDINQLPERVAVMVIMFLMLRWFISPTRENYELMPDWARPCGSQLTSLHPVWMDTIPFPIMRENASRDYAEATAGAARNAGGSARGSFSSTGTGAGGGAGDAGAAGAVTAKSENSPNDATTSPSQTITVASASATSTPTSTTTVTPHSSNVVGGGGRPHHRVVGTGCVGEPTTSMHQPQQQPRQCTTTTTSSSSLSSSSSPPAPTPFEHFFIPFTSTLSLNWPYGNDDVLMQSADGGGSDDVAVTPAFERHLRRIENWTLGPAFLKAFPHLEGTFNLKGDDGRIVHAG